MAAGGIALVAGAPAQVAVRLGVAMLFLQFSIGSANDVIDASADSVGGREKPIARGRVSAFEATLLSAVAAAIGLSLAASVGTAALAIAIIGLADGLVYDLLAKGTPWSWAPFAIGVGLLPIYAWAGATGCLTVPFGAVFALAVVAGAALAVGNALADAANDATAGTATIVNAIGVAAAVRLDVALIVCAQAVVVATAIANASALSVTTAAVLAVGLVAGWIGLVATARGGEPRRLIGWEAQGVGLAMIGIVWVQLLSAAGVLSSRC